MGKRIRHLEFYGFADQNKYNSLSNIDLSEIHETNREQDEDIDELSGLTAEKADIATVNALSGKVDSFIAEQSGITQAMKESIEENRNSISKLEEWENQATDSINGLIDDVDSIEDNVEQLSAITSGIQQSIDDYLSGASGFAESIKELETKVDTKLDKAEAEEIYLKKEDALTKEDVNDMLASGVSGYATEQWVKDQGYLTSADTEGKYATITSVNNLSNRVDTVQSELNKQYADLNADYTNFKSTTNTRLTAQEQNLQTLEAKHDREIAELQAKDNTFDGRISANAEAIKQINDVSLPAKADKADIQAISGEVANFAITLQNKVDKNTYDVFTAQTNNSFDKVNETKADKSALTSINDAIQEVADALDKETQDRETADNVIKESVSGLQQQIDSIKEDNVGEESDIQDLRDALDKEILDRQNGDAAIVGTEADGSDMLTLYGLRKYAEHEADVALNDAKQYADSGVTNLETKLMDTIITPLETQLNGKADSTYVDGKVTEAYNDLQTAVEEAVEAEKAARELGDKNLETMISSQTASYSGLTQVVSNQGTILGGLTSWNGDGDYSSEDGEGVVDVMHRELHDLAESVDGLELLASGMTMPLTFNYNGVELFTYQPTKMVVADLNVYADNVPMESGSDITIADELAKKANAEAIQLVQNSALEYELKVGDKSVGTINIPKDQFLKHVDYDSATHQLKFTFETTEGEVSTSIDISDLVDIYSGGNGVDITNNIVSAKIDPSSDSYLTVGENGILLSGVAQELANKVGYVNIETVDNPGRKGIVLANHDTILGTTTSGGTVNVAMVSKWDKVDLGSAQVSINLNGKDERPTYNDDEEIALLKDIQDVSGAIDSKYDELKDELEQQVSGLQESINDEAEARTQGDKANADAIQELDETKADKDEIPTKLPNPYALTIKYNGVEAFTYDGSKAETGNFRVYADTVPMTSADSTTIANMLDALDSRLEKVESTAEEFQVLKGEIGEKTNPYDRGATIYERLASIEGELNRLIDFGDYKA